MMPPNLPANDTARTMAARSICVPRPARPSTGTPPPAPRRFVAKPSKPGPPPLPSKAPPPLPQPALLDDADLIDDEDMVHAARNSLPTSEDVDLECFTLSEPPPESRPQRKRAWLAGITGLVLVTMTGVLLLARPVSDGAIRLLNANDGAARAPAMLTVAAISTSSPASVPQNPATSALVGRVTEARAKLSIHSKSAQKSPTSAKQATKRGTPKRAPSR
jgi:hypothetical protein